MPRSRLYYHIIWGTKNREPLITPLLEPLIFNFIKSKALGLGGHVYELNGTDDHIHLLAHIPGTIPVTQFIGKIKGSSSARINKSSIGEGSFYWQSEYAISTLSEFMVPKLKKYISKQKEHHQKGSLNNKFELI